MTIHLFSVKCHSLSVTLKIHIITPHYKIIYTNKVSFSTSLYINWFYFRHPGPETTPKRLFGFQSLLCCCCIVGESQIIGVCPFCVHFYADTLCLQPRALEDFYSEDEEHFCFEMWSTIKMWPRLSLKSNFIGISLNLWKCC